MKTTRYAAQRISLVAGVVLGGLWAWQAGSSFWQHVIRFGIVLFIVVPIVLRILDHWPGGFRIDCARLVVVKAVLLVAALAASALLGRITDSADYLVAAGLAVVVALAGPRLLPYVVREVTPDRRS